MRKEEFAYDIKDRVMILAIERPGRVEALMIDFLGVQYRVCYWDCAERKSIWLSEDELKPLA